VEAETGKHGFGLQGSGFGPGSNDLRHTLCRAAGVMSRDHRNLRVFQQADELVLRVYHATRSLPPDERYGLQAQIRRAAVSAASNLVEGCARRKTREYQHFATIALGSASEARYLLSVAQRLDMMAAAVHRELDQLYESLLKGLQRLVTTLDTME
jgi:four helix bundle protein